MRRKIAAGNWKMNGTLASVAELLDGLLPAVASNTVADILLFPPFVHLAATRERLAGSPARLGAQNLSTHEKGAHTGEVSGPMLRDAGCEFVLVGHSERRAMYGETNEVVADKFAAAQAAGLVPVLCVGETLEERESGITETVTGDQLDAVIDRCGVAALAQSILAYEPVWAIGTGKTATPQQAQDVHAFLRARIADKDANIAGSLRVLYGGSVNGGNANELFSQPDVDGGLVGGASLDATSFAQICDAAAT